MKPSKAILIIVAIIVILLVIAWIVNQSNKTKTANALMSQPAADANTTGRFIAVSSNGTDYTELLNGKAVWLWVGRGNAQSGYVKITEGKDAGWSILNDYLISGKSSYTCLEYNNSTPRKCIKWSEGKDIFISA